MVALSQQIHVFTFPSPAQRLFTIETRANALGLCEVTPFQTAERQLLMFPGHKMGSVQLVVRICIVFTYCGLLTVVHGCGGGGGGGGGCGSGGGGGGGGGGNYYFHYCCVTSKF